VAPRPIVPLVSSSLVVVRAVSLMALYQVAPVGMIFAAIPIVVVAMVTIIDSHLNSLLRTGCCHDRRGREDSSSYQQ
jgi:hypothetical protein